jgi:hypothetical protein
MKRLAVLSIAALLFTAGVVGLGGGRAVAAAQATPAPTQTCVLIIFCTGSSPSPSPSPTGSAPAPSPSSAPTATAAPTPTADPSTPGEPSASASASASSPSPTDSPSATDSPSPSGSPSPTGTASAAKKKKKAAVTPKDASAAPGLVVSNATWTMSVDSATMTNFQYKGNVALPLAGGGTVTMMEFTVDSMSMSGATTVITEAGQTGTETDASFTASGVTMYATKLSGSLLGVPVTFTPSTASAVLLDIANLITGVVPITMTNVTADQTVILAGQAQKTAVGVTG